MQTTDPFTAEILRASAQGLALLAAERVVQRLDLGQEGLGTLPTRAWQEQLAGHLTDLAQALDEGAGRALVDQVAWSRAAFAARELPDDQLKTSLECLSEVLWDELPEEPRAAAVGLLAEVLASFESPAGEVPAILSPGEQHAQLAAGYLTAMLEGDRSRATRLVLDSVRDGSLSVRDALLGVCSIAQREIGRMWHLDEVTIAEEHAVSAATTRLMSQLMAFAPEVEPAGRQVLAASTGDDPHDIGLRLVCELFELDGWSVVFLGCGVPARELVWAAEEFEPDLLLLSAATDAHRLSVKEAIALLREGCPDLPVLVGGPGFDRSAATGEVEPWRACGADAGGVGASRAVNEGRRLVGLDARA